MTESTEQQHRGSSELPTLNRCALCWKCIGKDALLQFNTMLTARHSPTPSGDDGERKFLRCEFNSLNIDGGRDVRWSSHTKLRDVVCAQESWMMAFLMLRSDQPSSLQYNTITPDNMASLTARASRRLRLLQSARAEQWTCRECLQRRAFSLTSTSRQQSSTTPKDGEGTTHFGFSTVAESMKASKGT